MGPSSQQHADNTEPSQTPPQAGLDAPHPGAIGNQASGLPADLGPDVVAQVANFETQISAFKELFRKQAILQLEIRRQQEALEQRDADAAAREEELSRLRDQNAAQALELTQRAEQLTAAQHTLDDRELELMQRTEDLARQEQALSAVKGEHDQSVLASREALDAALAKLAAAQSAHDEQVRKAAADAAAFNERTEQLAAREQQAVEQLTAAQASHDAAARRLRELTDHEKRLLAQSARLAEDREALAHESAQLALAREQLAEHTDTPTLADPSSQLAIEETIREYEALWLYELHDGATARADIAQLEEVIEGLKERLKSAHQAASKPAQIITRIAHPQGAERESLARRRERLKLYKALVRKQAGKVRRASDAIKRRYEQVEQVLAQRADLASARLRILEAEKKEKRHVAASRSAAVVLCLVAVFGLVGAISWAIAREIAPAHFAATAILKAESKERALGAGELAEWQTVHQNLLTDPRLHEALAERFKRQSITSLAGPADVAELARTALTSESGADGELKLRLEGLGADATSRTLEIFTNGFVNYVNSGNIARADGANTVIAQPATPGADPIDHVRTQYALLMACGGSALCMVLGSLIWRRLASAKSTFEADTQMEELLSGPTITPE